MSVCVVYARARVCVCVRERERERERKTETETDRGSGETGRETESRVGGREHTIKSLLEGRVLGRENT